MALQHLLVYGEMWVVQIAFVLFIFFFLSSVNGGYSAIDDCVKLVGNDNKKKPSISLSACSDSDAGLCYALFQLNQQTIQENLME